MKILIFHANYYYIPQESAFLRLILFYFMYKSYSYTGEIIRFAADTTIFYQGQNLATSYRPGKGGEF